MVISFKEKRLLAYQPISHHDHLVGDCKETPDQTGIKLFSVNKEFTGIRQDGVKCRTAISHFRYRVEKNRWIGRMSCPIHTNNITDQYRIILYNFTNLNTSAASPSDPLMLRK